MAIITPYKGCSNASFFIAFYQFQKGRISDDIMNDDNLIDVTKRSKSEARALSVKGGINSGIARRKKKQLKSMMEIGKEILGSKITDKDMKKKLKEMGVPEEDMTYQMAMFYAMSSCALRGNTKAYEILMKQMGMDAPVVDTASIDEHNNSISQLQFNLDNVGAERNIEDFEEKEEDEK